MAHCTYCIEDTVLWKRSQQTRFIVFNLCGFSQQILYIHICLQIEFIYSFIYLLIYMNLHDYKTKIYKILVTVTVCVLNGSMGWQTTRIV